MAACGQLKKGMQAPCDPAIAGLKQKLVLVRHDDIASAVRSTAVPKGVNLGLKTGKKGFAFDGLGESNAARVKMAPSKFGSPTYTHEVDMIAFGVSPEDTETVEDLARDRVVSIVPDNNGYYPIYGLNAGLELSKADSDTNDKDTGGAPALTLSSDKEKGRQDFFMVFDSTGGTPVYDPIATKAAFEALYA